MQIIVLGPHRSGTSAVTRLIALMGAYVGEEKDTIGANEENPKGFWERKDVVACNDAILASRHCTWDCLAEWNMERPPSLGQEITNQMQAVIATLNEHALWAMKDPRTCITLPCWKPYLTQSVAVIVYRDPLEVARSLHTRNGFSLQTGLALWEYSAVGLLNAGRDMKQVFVHYADLIEKPEKTAQKLYKDLQTCGIKTLSMPSAKDVQEFIEPEYYRSKVAEAVAADVLNPAQSALTRYHMGKTSLPDKPLTVSYASVEAMRFHSLTQQRQKQESQYEILVKAYATLQANHAQLEIQLEDAHQQTASLRNSVVESKARMATLEKAMEINTTQARENILQLTTRVEQQAQEQQILQSRLEQQAEVQEKLQFQLHSVLSSTTWRVATLPGRILKRLGVIN